MTILNGRLPASMLAYIPGTGQRIRADLVPQTVRLMDAFFEHFDKSLTITDGYRDYAAQVRVKAIKGKYAATPGYSQHGWGQAIDFGSRVNVDRSAEFRWMNEHGPTYGWLWPAWASDHNPANGQYEPWHREGVYVPAPLTPLIPIPDTPEEETMSSTFTATGPNGQTWLIDGVFKRPITIHQRDLLSVLAPPATVPWLQNITEDALAAYADIGGDTRITI